MSQRTRILNEVALLLMRLANTKKLAVRLPPTPGLPPALAVGPTLNPT